jgi:hypothetical protein
LNDIVIDTNGYVRHKISEFQLSPRSIWNSWSDVSVPEMKESLGLIINMINMGLMPLPNIQDYWSSEWTTQVHFFGDVISRVCFLHIYWMIHPGSAEREERLNIVPHFLYHYERKKHKD